VGGGGVHRPSIHPRLASRLQLPQQRGSGARQALICDHHAHSINAAAQGRWWRPSTHPQHVHEGGEALGHAALNPLGDGALQLIDDLGLEQQQLQVLVLRGLPKGGWVVGGGALGWGRGAAGGAAAAGSAALHGQPRRCSRRAAVAGAHGRGERAVHTMAGPALFRLLSIMPMSRFMSTMLMVNWYRMDSTSAETGLLLFNMMSSSTPPRA
jgi:hypothetical protein